MLSDLVALHPVLTLKYAKTVCNTREPITVLSCVRTACWQKVTFTVTDMDLSASARSGTLHKPSSVRKVAQGRLSEGECDTGVGIAHCGLLPTLGIPSAVNFLWWCSEGFPS